MPIEVILFDLGNVILPFSHFQIAEKLSRFTQEREFQDPQKIFSYLFDFEKGAVNGYETGRASSTEFFQSLKNLLHLSISFEEFIPIWNDIFTEDREVSEIIRSLKGKKRLGLISNTNSLHFDYILSTFPIIRPSINGFYPMRWVLKNRPLKSFKEQSSGLLSNRSRFFSSMIPKVMSKWLFL